MAWRRGLCKGCALALCAPVVMTGLAAGLLLYPAFRTPPKPPPMRDGEGRVVQYRGVNLSNYSKHSPGHLPWHTREDFALLRDWGFNLVRYLVFWEAIEPEPGQYDEAYLDATVERIAWLEELGIDVLVDLHQDLYAQRFGGNGFPDWTVNDGGHAFTPRQPWNLTYAEPAVRASYRHFWHNDDLKARYAAMLAHLGTRLDACPNVVGIDVMNEPWPSPLLGFERRVLSPFYERLQAARRGAGFAAPLWFEPVIYTSAGLPSRLRFSPDPGSVLAAHYYDPMCHEGIRYTRFARMLMKAGVHRRLRDAARLGVPLLYGEFGISVETPGYAEWLGDFLGLLRQHGVGWTYYSYDKTGDDSFGLLDIEGNPRHELLDHLVSVYPQRVAGENIETKHEKNRLTLSYDPAGINVSTVIAIPKQCAGARVSVNGKAMHFDPGARRFEHSSRPADGRQTITVDW